MHNITPEMKAHLKGSVLTLCTLWKVTREDGQVFGFTDYRKDIRIENTNFIAQTGYRPSAIKTGSSLAVDNLEVEAPLYRAKAITDINLTSHMMTEEDIEAGKWDYARVDIWKCNYNDLSMGVIKVKSGHIGNITTKRNTYTAELRGLTQPLQQQVGRIYTPGCAANFGDKNCRVNKALYTFSGRVTRKISQNNWIDESLYQTNSVNTFDLTNATKSSPIVVTTLQPHNLAANEQITFYDVSGMTQLNGITAPINYIGSHSFSIPVDGTNFSDYSSEFISNGKASKKEISEYFKDGYLVWTSGLNEGIKCGVKSYRPNNVTLYDTMVYEIKEGDFYSITAGCDKLPKTCNDRFDNIVNFYGFNLVPGNNRIMSEK